MRVSNKVQCKGKGHLLIFKCLSIFTLMTCFVACSSSPERPDAGVPAASKTVELAAQGGSGLEVQEASDDDKGPYERGPYEKAPNGPSVVVGVKDTGTTASVIDYEDYKDPLMWLNRPIFRFNHVSYKYVLSPLAKGYQFIVPQPVDTGIGNFFSNLREPLYFLNNLLQGKAGRSGKNILRFGVNSTIGVLGLFDPAANWLQVEHADTNFADTLSVYGVGYGAYLVLPLLGPSDLRDGASLTFEYFLHPLRQIDDQQTATALLVVDGFHGKVAMLSDYAKVVDSKEDPYLFVRNLYLQSIQRDADALRRFEGQEENLAPTQGNEASPAKKDES